MYEVTYSVDGIRRTINIPAQDSVQAQNTITRMFGTGKVQILNVVRK